MTVRGAVRTMKLSPGDADGHRGLVREFGRKEDPAGGNEVAGRLMRIPANVITSSGNVITDSDDDDHSSERSDVILLDYLSCC
jgi:hypothetical protein